MALNEENVRWELHENVVQRMKDAGSDMTLMVVTPSAPLTVSFLFFVLLFHHVLSEETGK